jgi:hypothetical protein
MNLRSAATRAIDRLFKTERHQTNGFNTAASAEIDKLGQKNPTAAEIIREAFEGRRNPLRGRQLVDIARKIGLGWEDTGTGWKPGTLFRSRDGAQYIVNNAGSLERVIVHNGRAYKAAPKLTKKERNKQKREARKRAELATERSQ